MRVVVLDVATPQRGRTIAQKFVAAGAEAFFRGPSEQAEWLNTSKAVDNIPTDVGLIVVHDTDSAVLERLVVRAPCTLRYTGGRVADVLPAGELWIMRPVTSAQDAISEREAREILEWIEWGADRDNRPLLLRQAQSLRMLPALAILCQGYVAKHFLSRGMDAGPDVGGDVWRNVLRNAGFVREDDREGESFREIIRARAGSETRSLDLRDWQAILGEITPAAEMFQDELRKRTAPGLVDLIEKVNASQEPALSDVVNAYLDLVELLRGDGSS